MQGRRLNNIFRVMTLSFPLSYPASSFINMLEGISRKPDLTKVTGEIEILGL